MPRYAAPPTASPRPSASSLVITTPAPSPLRARAALNVTAAPRPGERPQRMPLRELRHDGPLDVPSSAGDYGDHVTDDPYEVAREAAGQLAARTGVERHDALVVLGAGSADALGDVGAEFAVHELPGFLPPVAQGHAGRIRSTRLGDRAVLVVLGRTHLYEGHGPAPVVHAVRMAAAAGCRTAVLTNAS